MPTARAGRKLKLRLLSARLAALAERYVRELEETPGVDLDKLGEALELMKMAKLAARPRKPRPLISVVPAHDRATLQGPRALDEPTRPIMQLCAADVSLQAAPRAAVEDFLASRAPAASAGAGAAPAPPARDAERAACVDAGAGAALGLVHSPPHPEERSKARRTSQVGYSRLAHLTMPISGKPEIGGWGGGVQWPKERKPMCFMGTRRGE